MHVLVSYEVLPGVCTVRPEPPTYRRESQYTVYPEHPYKSDTWHTKQGRGQSVGVSDTPKHLASEDTQSRQDTGVIEEATTGKSQGRGVARAMGLGSVGGSQSRFRGSGTH